MRIPLDTRTALFGVFILGLAISYAYFSFIQQSDRSVGIDQQLREVEERLAEAEMIYRSCASLSQAGTSAPSSVRSGCIESRGFVLFVRGFPFDPKLNELRQEMLTLARTIEEVTDAIAIRPTSAVARELLETVPAQIESAEREIDKAKQWWRF